MKIVLTGAGGGHFFPLIAVAERVRKEMFIQKITQPEMYFFSDKPYNEELLFSAGIVFKKIPAGKLRLYPSFETITDGIKTVWGCLVALIRLYSVYPDVVFAKGGYASFPTLFAARFLSIPVVVHESDTVGGRTTLWAGKFASRVAISYAETAHLYPASTVALTGQPIRDELLPPENFIRTFPQKERPVILILGGSQGSQKINELVLSVLPELLTSYDIVHQAGPENSEAIKEIARKDLQNHPFKEHYFVEGFIDMAIFYPKVDMVITRAGSSMFEMALWQLPMIVIPIPQSISRDQYTNAYTMAGHRTAIVLEENNVSPHVFVSAIKNILDNQEMYMKMADAGRAFENSRTAATTIARELVRIGLSHTH